MGGRNQIWLLLIIPRTWLKCSDVNKTNLFFEILKAHHYDLGNDKPDYNTEHNDKFDEKKAHEVDKTGFQNPYKANFSLKHNSAQSANPYVSEYKEEIGDGKDPKKTKGVNPAGVGDNNTDNQISSILFGTDPTKPEPPNTPISNFYC